MVSVAEKHLLGLEYNQWSAYDGVSSRETLLRQSKPSGDGFLSSKLQNRVRYRNCNVVEIYLLLQFGWYDRFSPQNRTEPSNFLQ